MMPYRPFDTQRAGFGSTHGFGQPSADWSSFLRHLQGGWGGVNTRPALPPALAHTGGYYRPPQQSMYRGRPVDSAPFVAALRRLLASHSGFTGQPVPPQSIPTQITNSPAPSKTSRLMY